MAGWYVNGLLSLDIYPRMLEEGLINAYSCGGYTKPMLASVKRKPVLVATNIP